VSSAALDHTRQHLTGETHRCQEIGRQDLSNPVFFDVLYELLGLDPGIIYQNVNWRDLLFNSIYEAREFLRVRCI
tara:strand:- start:109 stop:333 length:225 start_codon:yes stop_codon:yes gene_type:complete